MTAPCIAVPTASLCLSRRTLLTDRTAATAYGAGTHAAPAASPRSRLARIRSARLIHFAALCLLLLFGWTSVGKGASIPTKEIWFFNNTDQNTPETLYVVLISGARITDEWLQAFTGISAAQRNAGMVWATTKDYRVYINGKTGIPPKGTMINGVPAKGYAKIRVPFWTYLVPWTTAITGGPDKDLVIDWWNGGRVAVYDATGKTALANDYDKDVKDGNFIDVAGKKIPNNLSVECIDGDCSELKVFGGVGGLPDNDPSQLTEFSFGSALTDPVIYKDKPFGWIEDDVGYNISSVDQIYMPVAMEPVGNPLIPYIGSVKPPQEIRDILAKWSTAHPGWPVYKGFPTAHPRIPSAGVVFFDAYKSDDTGYNTASPLTEPGKQINDMVSLYAHCVTVTTDTTDTCLRIRDLVNNLFDKNYLKYTGLACSKGFVKTVTWQLRNLYGWVPYNFNCNGGNDLALTLGTDDKAKAEYQRLANSYRLEKTEFNPTPGLQYNYQTEKNSTKWFNPYVELIHSADYLNMRQYAFSIDDAVGFQGHKGNGLIYAVGGTNGLDNKHELKPNEVVNVTYGGNSQWQSAELCSKENTINLNPVFPSFDFYPRNLTGYPCLVSAQNSIRKLAYQFKMTKGPPEDTVISCDGVSDPDWCKGINFSGNHNDHISTPAVNIK